MAPACTDQRGATLLEAMIAMAILTVGMLGLMKLQILGMYSNQGARANTQAAQLARELVGGIDTLPPDSPRLAPTTNFGPLLQGDGTAAAAVDWDDAQPITGVRLDAAIEPDPQVSGKPLYRRRWSVVDFGPTGAGSSVRMVAVSVIWHERGLQRPRELVLYVAKPNPGLVLANASAYR